MYLTSLESVCFGLFVSQGLKVLKRIFEAPIHPPLVAISGPSILSEKEVYLEQVVSPCLTYRDNITLFSNRM